jgi:hypothetical protein
MALRKFIIDRDIPKVGTFEREQLREAAQKSNGVSRQLGPDIQWVESYGADDKTFCAAHRTRQEPVGGKQTVGDGNRTRCGLQRIELIYIRVSESDRGNANRLPLWGGIAGQSEAPSLSRTKLVGTASQTNRVPGSVLFSAQDRDIIAILAKLYFLD